MLSTTSKDSETKDGENRTLIKIVERPFILKTREGESRAVSPSQRNKYVSHLIIINLRISSFVTMYLIVNKNF